MWTSAEIAVELKRRGELWEPVPGLLSLRGDTLDLFERIEARVASVAAREGFPKWRTAPGLPFETLDRAQYFESFPQWLTAAGHLSDDPARLEAVATADDSAAAAAAAVERPECALSPAMCYHTYARLAGETVETVRMTTQGTCWRHEGDRLRPLERGWAFTMRELVVLGSARHVERFRLDGMTWARTFASELRIDHEIVPATDPFFAPTSRGKEVLQRMKGLKHELVLPIGAGRTIAAASFNNHEAFFGERFDIRRPDGAPAASGCVAFGLERWLLAFLVAHGPDAVAWPDFESDTSLFDRVYS